MKMILAALFAAILPVLPLRAKDLATDHRAKHEAVRFDAFVEWDFRHRQKLRGWRATALLIRETLRRWEPGGVGRLLENGSRAGAREFLRTLPGADASGLSLVYLATHQSSEGEWDFTGRGIESVAAILQETPMPAHRTRVVIVDACHADAARAAIFSSAALSVFSAAADELAYEVRWFDRQPIDFPKRYPAETAWVKSCLGRGWDGRLSFFGFAFARAVCATNEPPRDLAEWEAFFRRCAEMGAILQETPGRKLASRISVVRN
jgi:hypothetical protein